MIQLPLVSISCITFNHASYLRQCLDSFLMQKIDFLIEIVIHDDASTDGTKAIIEEYQCKHPDMIFPMFQQENQYSQGLRGMMIRYNLPRCRGKYIACCEGDDYWLDPYKLQKQVDFMEQNPDYMFSMGRVNFLYQSSMTILPKKEFIDPAKHEFFTLGDYLKQPFSQTSTFLFRNRQLEMPDWIPKVSAGDQSLVIIMTGEEGKIKFHDDYFSVYRVNENSVMKSNFIKVLENNIQAFKYWNEYTSYKYNKLLLSRIIENYIVYFIFKPRFMRKLYKNYFVESILQFFYKGIMLFKNMGRQ
jgi:glycosyltransferase involved in cell wall biosynthesis